MDSTSTPSTSVPLFDLKAQYAVLAPQLQKTCARVLASGYYVMGPEVAEFEAEWAQYCGRKHAVMVSTGTDALSLTLAALRLNPIFRLVNKDKVLTTPFTFWATTQAIIDANMKPEFIDIDPVTGNVPDQDFGGQPALMVPHYGRPGAWLGSNVVEDRAHAHGANYSDVIDHIKPRAACYSFYPTKNLGAVGEGGAVVTDDDILALCVREMRSYGEKQRFQYHTLTGNHRPHELQAALLRVKLPFLDVWNHCRRQAAKRYIDGLQEINGKFINVPPDHPGHVYHIFAILAEDRDNLAAWLKSQNIGSQVRYPICCHQQPAYPMKELCYPNAERWAAQNLTLPLYPEMTPDQTDYVIDRILYYYQKGEGSKR